MEESKLADSSNARPSTLNKGSRPRTSSVDLSNQVRKVAVLKNKGFLAQPINQIGNQAFTLKKLFPPMNEPLDVKKALFPRSVVYEIEYKKKQNEKKILEALERERKAFEERLKQKMGSETDIKEQKTMDNNDNEMDNMKKEMEPFWYKSGEEGMLPPSNSQDYDINVICPQEITDPADIRGKIGISGDGNYFPGQMSGQRPKQMSPDQKMEEAQEKKTGLTHSSPTDVQENNYYSQIKGGSISQNGAKKYLKKFESECHPKKPSPLDGLINIYPNDYMGKTGKKIDRSKLLDFFHCIMSEQGEMEDWPVEKSRLTPWGDLRSQEFMKVGRPFKIDAVRWAECHVPPFNKAEEIKAIAERRALKLKQAEAVK